MSGFGGGIIGAGVVGVAAGTPNPSGQEEECGVYGRSDQYCGVYGYSEAQLGYGVQGNAPAGVGGTFLGGRAPLWLLPPQFNYATPPTLEYGYELGMLWMGHDARLWIATSSSSDGDFKPLNSVIPITPIRVLDTRNGTGGYSGYQNNTTLTLTLSNGQIGANGHTTTVPIPDLAIGLLGNVRAYTPQAPGYLTVYPGNGSPPGTSNVNYIKADASEQPYAICNQVTVGLSNKMVSIFVSATTHVVFDLVGYIQ